MKDFSLFKTLQTADTTLPSEQLSKMAIALFCYRCQAARVFKIHDSLTLIAKREHRGILIESKCEGCQIIYPVWLGLIDDQPGYSWRLPPVPDVDHEKVVADQSGLKPWKD